MRWSLVLGLIGSIIALLVGIAWLALGNVNGQMSPLLSADQYLNGGISILAAILGFAGAFMGKKIGGALMIIAGIIVIFAGLGGILSLILLVIGGVLALREKEEED